MRNTKTVCIQLQTRNRLTRKRNSHVIYWYAKHELAGVCLMSILWQNIVWSSRSKCTNSGEDITPPWCFGNNLILSSLDHVPTTQLQPWKLIYLHKMRKAFDLQCLLSPAPDCNHGMHCKWTRGDGWCRLWVCGRHSREDWPLCWEGNMFFIPKLLNLNNLKKKTQLFFSIFYICWMDFDNKLNGIITITDCGEAWNCNGACNQCLDRSNKRTWTMGGPSCRGVKARA